MPRCITLLTLSVLVASLSGANAEMPHSEPANGGFECPFAKAEKHAEAIMHITREMKEQHAAALDVKDAAIAK
jgi:hypothetical protein